MNFEKRTLLMAAFVLGSCGLAGARSQDAAFTGSAAAVQAQLTPHLTGVAANISKESAQRAAALDCTSPDAGARAMQAAAADMRKTFEAALKSRGIKATITSFSVGPITPAAPDEQLRTGDSVQLIAKVDIGAQAVSPGGKKTPLALWSVHDDSTVETTPRGHTVLVPGERTPLSAGVLVTVYNLTKEADHDALGNPTRTYCQTFVSQMDPDSHQIADAGIVNSSSKIEVQSLIFLPLLNF